MSPPEHSRIVTRHRTRAQRPEPGRLPAWQRWTVYATAALLVLSGVLWLVFHYAMPVETEFGTLPHPLEYQSLRVHGAAAMLALLVFGSLLPGHIQRAWDGPNNRVTGILVIGALLVLTVTGYLLYYFATEASRFWIGTLHWGLGLALIPAFAWHVRAANGRRRRRQKTPGANFQAADARAP